MTTMTKFSLLVAIPALALECCDVAVHTDRVVVPFLQDPKPGTHNSALPLRGYYIAKDDHDNRLNFSVPESLAVDDRSVPDAFVDLQGVLHRCSGIPLAEWATRVIDFVDALPTNMRLVVCHCYG